ncbi:hypothetical protein H4J57_02155 [Colwellia sp. BRX8-7]|jgi:hypothetical protein|uniref:hypothetical protein n=1 Tax=unclassified Colwellia TaxID=196834 RepID=UPI0015F58535|nr:MULTISPECIES: hypothetical protein [unclassified Colwellia]MBA6336001.1 hypothetical protein [Colwellia sp. BRX8-7]MBA6396189.1 hypothetical protein [Colwellia sp. BRX10-4]
MNDNYITLFVKMSDEDALLEQKLEQQKLDVSNKIHIAIKHQEPLKELQDLEMKLHCSIRDLKGGVYANKGQRMPINSTELAQSLLEKAKRVAKLEINFINDQLDELRKKMRLIKDRIESIVSFSIEHELNKKFDDFEFIIKCWEFEKSDIFDKPERCERAFAINSIPMIANNLIGYYIKKLRLIQFRIGELNLYKDNGTQVDALISDCGIVMSCDDDNLVFNEIFLMGQRAGNLNNIESNINALIATGRSQREASSKSDWANELAQQVYLNFWIYGKAPTTNEVERKFPSLINDRKTKTVGDQLTKQRKYYSNIDNRVPIVKSKGRNKKI